MAEQLSEVRGYPAGALTSVRCGAEIVLLSLRPRVSQGREGNYTGGFSLFEIGIRIFILLPF